MNVVEQQEFSTLEAGLFAGYRWTTGPLIGGFLAALRDGPAIAGGRCRRCGHVSCPPVEVCPGCGGGDVELTGVGPGGEVVAHAPLTGDLVGQPLAPPFAWVLVKLDGADDALAHLAPGEAGCSLSIGDRVEARFRADRDGSILDVEGFFASSSRAAEPAELPAGLEPLVTIEGRLELPFSYSYGEGFARFYRELKEGRIVAVRCPECKRVLLPPRPMCGSCYVEVERDWVAVSDHGTVRTFTVVHMPYEGQPTDPPYAYALVVLDGADGEFHHIVSGVPLEDVRVGMRVQARWRPPEERRGSFYDIECFVPEEGDGDGPG